MVVLPSESQKPVSVSGFDEHVLQDLDALLENSACLGGVCMINILSPVCFAYEQKAGSTKCSWSRLEHCLCLQEGAHDLLQEKTRSQRVMR